MGETTDRQEIQGIFKKVKQIPLDTPLYMSQRTLARLEARESKGPVFWWRSLALASSTLCIVLVLFFSVSYFTGKGHTSFRAFINKPVAIKIEMKNISQEAVHLAEIKLPDGVTFYSKRYPDMIKLRNLQLVLEGAFRQSELPFVVQSDRAGIKEVEIRFYNKDKVLIASETIEVHFIREKLL